jgi:hypothetical protein
MGLGGGFGIYKSGGGSGMSSGLTYKGTWNANTNTPTLGNGGAGGVQGDYYIVSVAGNTSLDGESDWGVGDWVVNNGSEWQKIDNSEPPTIYRDNSTVGTSRVATLTDTLLWTGGTVRTRYQQGGITITQGTGTNPLGFGVIGSGSLLNTAGQWDAYLENYESGGNPAIVASVYDNTTFVENACYGVATTDLGTGQQPYGFLYYTLDNVSFKGIEVNKFGERLYSQIGGLTETAMNPVDRVLFVKGSGANGTGYIEAATFASLAQLLPVPTLYTQDDTIIGNRTVTGDESLIQFTNTNFRAQAADGAFLLINADESTLNGATVSITGSELLLATQDTYLAQAATTQQQFIFRDLGVTPFDGTLQNADLTAARTWTLPNATGTIALVSQIPSVAITLNRLPIGTGTAITDSNWEIVPNASAGFDIRPIAANSNIGGTAAANRVDTIFMSSTIDYSTDLTWVSSASTRMTLSAAGSLGIGLSPLASTFLTVRSQGNDDTTFLTTMQNSSGVRKFAVRDDGLSQFNTALTQNSGLGGAYQVRNIIADWTSASSTNEIEAGLSQRLTNTPTSDSTVRSAAARFSAQKTGAFEVFQTTGVIAEVLNTGSASYDVNSAAGMYGLQALLGNTSTPTLINNAFAIRTDTTSQAAGTFAHFGGINIELTNSTNTIIGNMYGIRVQDPVNTTGSSVTNSYVLYSDAFTNATNNWGLYLLGANTVSHIAGSLAIGTTLSSNAKLAVRGAGNTNATRAVLVESANGVDRFLINDDGQIALAAGTTASPITSSFGFSYRSFGYAFGAGFYPTSAGTAGVTIQMLGTTDNGLTVATQGAKSGTVTGINSTILSTGNTQAFGIRGNARNASNVNYAVYGNITGGWSITPTGIAYAGFFFAQANVDAEQTAVRGTAQFSNSGLAYTKTFIGVDGFAGGSLSDNATTSDIIGGKFAAIGNTTGQEIALLVPAIDGVSNDGTVVFGANSVSANASLVEATGDIEVIGSSNGLILEAPNGTRYRVTITNAGVLNTNLA